VAAGASVSVAAVDVGSNSVRLLVLDDRRSPRAARITTTRLAEGVDRTGHLADAAIERTVAAIAAFRDEWVAHGVPTDATHVRIAATSAVRDAEDRDRFLAAVKDAVGVARRRHQRRRGGGARLRRRERCGPDRWACLVVDVGGGSTELVVGRAGDVLAAVSTQPRLRPPHGARAAPDPPTAAQRAAAVATAEAVLTDGIATLDAALANHGLTSPTSGPSLPSQGPRRRSPRCTSGSRLRGVPHPRHGRRLADVSMRCRSARGDDGRGAGGARAPCSPAGPRCCMAERSCSRRALRLLGRPELVVSEADSLDALAAGLRA
jgi:exopolyphosphatase / guanosine-5'-triphosphate,3'-diphosphate pyrophosphatase